MTRAVLTTLYRTTASIFLIYNKYFSVKNNRLFYLSC